MATTPQEFLSNDFSHPHHRKAITAMIVAVIVFGLLVGAYIYSNSTPPPQPTVQRTPQTLALDNPPSNLTQEEIVSRQKTAAQPNPLSKLTPEQVKARQALVENI
ncbi:MAG: hypothetical protein A3C79_03420 [Candidatus Taylorbacteria bacterium RIFCSPHIGHO2_02_FULL_45_28]|uniref:Uncharacterized protein n=1 Tax=Candidatus Taylorbacteria bacterium RIFCSPHIGHO2_12_FULL_45_16 TaxID=1802315 RepID=A0A1G2N3E3_9BACT|nr:MAG: hypothetical protein A2830_01135 [Candidatus Taylorbacteria bacterium RIFCSPHIGHO2_01_FULL_44_110]OHA25007.1 MAG: hypothetical protein A3C79_03420 [Candidatus Taylorbacteria bacterium RIFCSPHIGHO2_02_FULL_45_28]OHA29822.1 MAG: hypothetical protein A3F51_03820 [Candidatus Taylorbacteria bacterium RIFCSPHIGHO2_12_FULL_45_16]OHA32768.1 MAG: hypothetical protein A3A23_00700 [Candidatus Taylorbacteria bacterium RIFCSPLOWO2_01_FULL_45_59]OHA39847.1 MAG: hypothetical protein A3I98_03730 [Candi